MNSHESRLLDPAGTGVCSVACDATRGGLAIMGVKERPILFSGPMVRAILDGRKTQTRRVVKPQPVETAWQATTPDGNLNWFSDRPHKFGRTTIHLCPYGKPGDRLWVRETWRTFGRHRDGAWEGGLEFRAGGQLRVTEPHVLTSIRQRHKIDRPMNWKPPIFMPRWASRITLEVTDVRVERLWDLTEEDAKAEGFAATEEVDQNFAGRTLGEFTMGAMTTWSSPAGNFQILWDSLHGEGAWDRNDWVWVIGFKVVP